MCPAHTAARDEPLAPMNCSESELRERAAQHGQTQLFAHWQTLSAESQCSLLDQIARVDFELVAKQAALLGAATTDAEGEAQFSPPELFPLQRDDEYEAQAIDARRCGAERLAAGKVAFLLVAGGQASRLGYDGPKGTFPVGPVSGRSLFDVHARRLLAAQALHGQVFDWYVMTSPANDAATREFFAAKDHFGLDPAHVLFFAQAMIPALDLEGRILLSSPDTLFVAPNGHGGTLAALHSSGLLSRARQRGVETLSYFQVDNPLVRPADTLFLGLHEQAGARMSSKVVTKRDAAEKVGVIGLSHGQLGCIEYSDLPANLREERDSEGRLVFGAGNIAAHLIQVDFVEELTRDGLELPWHVARKRMQVTGPEGTKVEVDGVKFETFIFDALGKSPASVTLEVDRGEEFSPVKNASGEDSPQTARAALCSLFGAWVAASGRALPEAGADGLRPVEVDALVAEDQATFLAGPIPEPRELDGGLLFERT